MRNYVFGSRWGALFLVLLVAAAAASLIGSNGHEGLLLQAAKGINQSRGSYRDQTKKLATPDKRPVIMIDRNVPDEVQSSSEATFASDAELIDPAEGIDPSPDIDPDKVVDQIAHDDDTAIVIDDGELPH